MKIGLHSDSLDQRGLSVVMYDYAAAIKAHLGHDIHIISSKPKSTHPMDRFAQFGYTLYNEPTELESIVDKEKIDVLYIVKAGNKDNICPTNVKTAIHCVFEMREQHGDVYAGVSEWLAIQHFKMPLWVPHIIDMPPITGTLHDELGIPKDGFVIGRHGGKDQFDIPFVHSAVKRSLEQRSDLWYVFLSTKPFIDHPRVKFLPFASTERKSQFINTCDAMLHGRSDGETFGLAVGEFSALNKPIITYDAPYWWYMRSHLHILGEKALTYKDEEFLLAYLLQIDKAYVSDVEWDCHSVRFSPKNVIERFNDIFIK